MNALAVWAALLRTCAPSFTRRSFAIFVDLVACWALAPGRRTVTAMISVADPTGRRAHDAYHRFFRDGAWSMSGLWRVLATYAIGRFVPTGAVPLDCDDTLYKKSGPKINGAGIFRDAVRSTVRRVVYALGLNLVVVTLRVSPPWGGCPIGLPISVRLRPKGDSTSTVEHAATMMRDLAGWLPDREFHLCADGAYASLAGAGLPHCQVTSRMRRDAAIYEPAPPPTGKRGRPRTRGVRLPTPPQLAAQAQRKDWKRVDIDLRGRNIQRLVYVRDVLWYSVNKRDLVRLVIVRDPEGTEPDDFFFTTDASATGGEVASRYNGRWSIEVTFRDAKQDLGAEDPQCWKRQGPERAAALSLWLHSLIWCWYIDVHPTGQTWTTKPWYRHKNTPSFLDALAALRRALWSQRITGISSSRPDNHKITEALLDTLAYAA
ncbi:MAG: IS701 family transposase [Acidimicrobiales bacterium]